MRSLFCIILLFLAFKCISAIKNRTFVCSSKRIVCLDDFSYRFCFNTTTNPIMYGSVKYCRKSYFCSEDERSKICVSNKVINDIKTTEYEKLSTNPGTTTRTSLINTTTNINSTSTSKQSLKTTTSLNNITTSTTTPSSVSITTEDNFNSTTTTTTTTAFKTVTISSTSTTTPNYTKISPVTKANISRIKKPTKHMYPFHPNGKRRQTMPPKNKAAIDHIKKLTGPRWKYRYTNKPKKKNKPKRKSTKRTTTKSTLLQEPTPTFLIKNNNVKESKPLIGLRQSASKPHSPHITENSIPAPVVIRSSTTKPTTIRYSSTSDATTTIETIKSTESTTLTVLTPSTTSLPVSISITTKTTEKPSTTISSSIITSSTGVLPCLTSTVPSSYVQNLNGFRIQTSTVAPTNNPPDVSPFCKLPAKHPGTKCNEFFECKMVMWWYKWILYKCENGFAFDPTLLTCIFDPSCVQK